MYLPRIRTVGEKGVNGGNPWPNWARAGGIQKEYFICLSGSVDKDYVLTGVNEGHFHRYGIDDHVH